MVRNPDGFVTESAKPARPAVSRGVLINRARLLKSVEGENLEYDRALIELINDTFGGGRDAIAVELGITRTFD